MRGAWSALLAALVAAVAATVQPPEDPQAQDALADLKARILTGLGMERLPDLSKVNVSVEHVQRMTRRYFRNLKQSEQELLTYHHKGFNKENYLIFEPDLDYMSSVQWARLRFPNSAYMDITPTVRKWKDNSTNVLQVMCHGRKCRRAKLEIMLRKSRSKRSINKIPCTRECCRRPLKISFKEIGWDWIVQPVEFEAFYCKGRCRNVSDDFASTHALMQSILNYQGRKVTRPCCAPRKLRPLDLLHYNDQIPPELVVTRQKGMIVKECACA